MKNYAFSKETIEPWLGEVLIMGGENDPLSDAEDRQKMEAFYPHAQVKVIH